MNITTNIIRTFMAPT
ncbi:NADH dehydrogenase subunit 6 [Iris pallida]|uniref:NADH dehydrogenase subunit 6 (Plastid) n=1 Tax=Iris pallida TaxID=29817 RepID=A0AAX6FKJ6_IRIPA|nr:NADH dehydrogenase subunit 6 [Iris pallida]